MKEKNTSSLVAIVGGSGAGKSWLAGQLQKLLSKKAALLSQDDFYRDRSHLSPRRRAQLNFDHPNAIDWPLLEQILHGCRTGKTSRLPRYDFATHTRLAKTRVQPPKPLVLVDGLWLLHRPSIRRLFDLSIFIDCPERIRFRRRLARDMAERDRTRIQVRRQFRDTVAPMHRRHVQPQIRWATIALRQPYRKQEVQLLADHFWTLLQASTLLPTRGQKPFRAKLHRLVNDNPLEDHE